MTSFSSTFVKFDQSISHTHSQTFIHILYIYLCIHSVIFYFADERFREALICLSENKRTTGGSTHRKYGRREGDSRIHCAEIVTRKQFCHPSNVFGCCPTSHAIARGYDGGKNGCRFCTRKRGARLQRLSNGAGWHTVLLCVKGYCAHIWNSLMLLSPLSVHHKTSTRKTTHTKTSGLAWSLYKCGRLGLLRMPAPVFSNKKSFL